MFEEELARLEKDFRQYQSPELNRKKMRELRTEVDSFVRQFPKEPRLLSLQAEIEEVLA